MKDPERLLHGESTEMERRLLAAGDAEEPSSRALRGAAAALGLVAAGALTAESAAGAGTAGASLLGSALKWLAAALVGASVVTAVGYALRPSPEPPAAVPQPPAALPSAQVGRSTPPAPASERPPPTPSAHGATAQTASAPRSAPSTESDSMGSLKAQIALLDSARQALAAGQPRAALTTLDRYAREFPRGELGQEATLLRIEALAQSGNRPGARALAARFLQGKPTSPHRKRIESLVGKLDVPAPAAP